MKFVNATKTMQIYKAPPILIFCLQRYKDGYKNNANITYPESLNMSPYVIKADSKNMIYDLYAVSNHSGSFHGGHYTAYCKNFEDG